MKKLPKKYFWSMLTALLCMVVIILPVFSQAPAQTATPTPIPTLPYPPIVIGGDFEDWFIPPILMFTDMGCVIPRGGTTCVDDERSPSRADITQFSVIVDRDKLYVMMAMDDTFFQQDSAIGINVRGGSTTYSYFRIYMTAEKTATAFPGQAIPLSSLQIFSCTDFTCANQTIKCDENPNTTIPTCGAAAYSAVGIPVPDPFFKAPDGPATNCAQDLSYYPTGFCNEYDTAVELSIPWKTIGEFPDMGILFQYGSYPNGPSVAPKDIAGDNGIACKEEDTNGDGIADTYRCYYSDPTALTVNEFTASPKTGLPWLPYAAGVLTLVCLGCALWLRRK